MTDPRPNDVAEAAEQLRIAINGAVPHPMSDGRSVHAITFPRKYAVILLDAFTSSRRSVMEEAARIADEHAQAAEHHASKLGAGDPNGISGDLPFRSRAVAAECRNIAAAIRAAVGDGT